LKNVPFREPDEIRLSRASAGWKGRIELWSVTRKTLITQYDFELPCSYVRAIIRQSVLDKHPNRIRLFGRFSRDLTRAVVLNCVVKIVPAKADAGSQSATASFTVEHIDQMQIPPDQTDSVDIEFSPDKRYLAISTEPKAKSRVIIGGRLMVWRDSGNNDEKVPHKLIGTANTANLLNVSYGRRQNFAFHPCLPLLVFSNLNGTMVWDLGNC
jgi:hypothetical protein